MTEHTPRGAARFAVAALALLLASAAAAQQTVDFI